VLQISLTNADSSQYAIIIDCTGAQFLLGPQGASTAFWYTGASGATFHQTSYLLNGLRTGYVYSDAGGGASLTKDGHLALDGKAVVDGSSSKHQLDEIGQYMAIAGIDENVVIVRWQNASLYGICAAASQMTSGTRQVLSGVSDYVVAAKLDTLKGMCVTKILLLLFIVKLQ